MSQHFNKKVLRKLGRFCAAVEDLIKDLSKHMVTIRKRKNMCITLEVLSDPRNTPLNGLITRNVCDSAAEVFSSLSTSFCSTQSKLTMSERHDLQEIFTMALNELFSIEGVKEAAIASVATLDTIFGSIGKCISSDVKYTVSIAPNKDIVVCVNKSDQVDAIREALVRKFEAFQLSDVIKVVYHARGKPVTVL